MAIEWGLIQPPERTQPATQQNPLGDMLKLMMMMGFKKRQADVEFKQNLEKAKMLKNMEADAAKEMLGLAQQYRLDELKYRGPDSRDYVTIQQTGYDKNNQEVSAKWQVSRSEFEKMLAEEDVFSGKTEDGVVEGKRPKVASKPFPQGFAPDKRERAVAMERQLARQRGDKILPEQVSIGGRQYTLHNQKEGQGVDVRGILNFIRNLMTVREKTASRASGIRG